MKQTIKTALNVHRKKLIVLVSVMLILTFLPVALKHAAIHYVETELSLADNVTITDIDLNLFTGHFEIEGLIIRTGNKETLSLRVLTVNMSMLSLLRKRILVESLSVEGLNLPVLNGKDVLTAGVPIPKATDASIPSKEGEPHAPVHFGISELTVSDSLVSYTDDTVSVSLPITLIRMTELFTWKPDNTATLNIDMNVDTTPVRSEIRMKPFAENREFNTLIKVDSFDLKTISGYAKPFVDDLSGAVTVDTTLDAVIMKDNTVRIDQKGTISVSDISCSPSGISIPVTVNDTALSWDGTVSVEYDAEKGFPLVHADGMVSNHNLDVALGDRKAVIRHDGLMWKGTVDIPDGGIKNSVVSGSAGLDNLRLTGEPSDVNILTLEALRLDDIDVKGLNQISTGLFSTRGLSVAKPVAGEKEKAADSLYSNGSVYISDIQLTDVSSLHVKSVELTDNTFYIHQTEPSQLPLINALKRFSTSLKSLKEKREERKKAAAGKPESQDKKQHDIVEVSSAGDVAMAKPVQPFVIGIDSIALAGNNIIRIIDKSVTPSFTKTITIDTFSVTGISNETINEAASVDLKLTTERHTSLALTGTVLPFTPKVNGDFKLLADNLNLVGFSPYVASKTGYNIKTGVLDAEINCKIVSDELVVDNNFVINNIFLIPDEDEKVDQFVKQFSMPLDYTLSVLRDSDNNVILSIPVSGNVRNPDFNYNDIFKKAAAKALQAASISVVKNLLQPYGAVITVAQYAYEGGKYVSKIRLDPMLFQPGVSVLDASGKDYLKSVAKLLKEKEGLRLSVCGFSTQEDFPEIAISEDPNPFIEMAQKRMEAVAVFLESQGIHHERIFTCNADSQAGEDVKPRVELSL